MAELIRGQVARVLNTRELLINRGSADGVRPGMRFAVLDPQSENVKDPETGDVLGSIFRPKVSVEVKQVEPRLCLAATYRKTRVNIGGSGSFALPTLAGLFEPPNFVDRYETFESSDQTWEELPESQSFVKIGDPVTQIVEAQAESGLTGAQLGGEPDQVAKPVSTARRPRTAKPRSEPDGAKAPRST
jgi:hypothetical protein